MIYTRRLLKVIPIILLISSCAQQIEIENFDSQQWKSEKNECKSYRIEKYAILQKSDSIFIGKSEHDIQKTFGKPDRLDLGKKHTKSIIYFIDNTSESCPKTDAKIKELRFELDPLSNVKFVIWDEKHAE